MAGERGEESGWPERGEKSRDGRREGKSMAEGEMREVGKEGLKG